MEVPFDFFWSDILADFVGAAEDFFTIFATVFCDDFFAAGFAVDDLTDFFAGSFLVEDFAIMHAFACE